MIIMQALAQECHISFGTPALYKVTAKHGLALNEFIHSDVLIRIEWEDNFYCHLLWYYFIINAVVKKVLAFKTCFVFVFESVM